jgi:uroporphyrinogen-III synthase
LEKQGLRCSALPREYLTAELGRVLAKMKVEGKNILLARAEIANKSISRIIRRAGALVTEVSVYRTIPGNHKKSLDLKMVTDLTLTSPSTVDGVLQSTTPEELRARGIQIHCIGPVTALHASRQKLDIATVAATHTIDGLINAIVNKSRKIPKSAD